jgi:acyl-CoA thioesterase I
LKVLAIGASSTKDYTGASLAKRSQSSFEGILERAFQGLDVVIVNRGVSGELAATTAERLKSQVALESPDLVLWQVGANDALSHVPVESFRRSVSEAIGWLKERNVDVVLVGLQYALAVAHNEYYGQIRSSLREIAAAQNVLLVRRFEVTAFLERENARTTTIDGGLDHNDLNYRCLAEHVARAIVVNAFLKK